MSNFGQNMKVFAIWSPQFDATTKNQLLVAFTYHGGTVYRVGLMRFDMTTDAMLDFVRITNFNLDYDNIQGNSPQEYQDLQSYPMFYFWVSSPDGKVY